MGQQWLRNIFVILTLIYCIIYIHDIPYEITAPKANVPYMQCTLFSHYA